MIERFPIMLVMRYINGAMTRMNGHFKSEHPIEIEENTSKSQNS